MRFALDRERYATGWLWLDRLTYPWWAVVEWWQVLRLDRYLGVSGPLWRRRAQRRAVWASVDISDIDLGSNDE